MPMMMLRIFRDIYPTSNERGTVKVVLSFSPNERGWYTGYSINTIVQKSVLLNGKRNLPEECMDFP